MAPNQSEGRFQAEVALTLFGYARPSELLRGVVNSNLIYGQAGQDFFDGSDDDLHLWVITQRAAPTQRMDSADPERVLPTGPVSEFETVREAANNLLTNQLGITEPLKLRALDYLDNPSRAGKERTIAFPFWGVVDISKVASYLGGTNQVGLQAVNSRGVIAELRDQFPSETFDGRCRFGYRVMPDSERGNFKYLPKDYQGRKILGMDHDLITFYAWRRLRYAFNTKVDPMRALGLNPLGKEFRLSDLQELYEVSLGETQQRDAFRRLMLEQTNPYIEESGTTDSSRQGKPAKVYRLKSWAEPGRSRN
jgi:ADP-ribose pyrophosphatase YjhB (NUDIX family)